MGNRKVCTLSNGTILPYPNEVFEAGKTYRLTTQYFRHTDGAWHLHMYHSVCAPTSNEGYADVTLNEDEAAILNRGSWI